MEMISRIVTVLICVFYLLNGVSAIEEVVELQATNFELILTSYRYAVILFHDQSTSQLLEQWVSAAKQPILADLSDSDCIMGHMNADDPEIEEVT